MANPSHGSGPDRDRTHVGTALPESDTRKTRIMHAGAQDYSGDSQPRTDTRRITGILVTYSWVPEGELFTIREGKNFIGRGNVASDASHQDCDIQVARDKRMSGEHALILCRQGTFEIIDITSANGTFLNDKLLTANAANTLPDRATIKTGDTLWTFIQIKPPERPQPVVKTPSPEGPEVKVL
jgi:pSer/pThr/pTyr-binding forkhead associated (FHA) protein